MEVKIYPETERTGIFRLVSGSIPPKKNVKQKNMGNLSKRKPYKVLINRNNQQVNSILKQTCIY